MDDVSKKKTVLMCLPPDGEQYGFPKIVPENRIDDVTTWMVEEGYPRQMIRSYTLFYPRYWRETSE